jgi:uncharacterized protein
VRGYGFICALTLAVTACKSSLPPHSGTTTPDEVHSKPDRQEACSEPAKSLLAVPKLRGRVNDYADLLTPAQENELGSLYESVEKELGSQIALLTIESLHGERIEEYSLRVANAWGLGRSGIDDGVLITLAYEDRLLRIEVGYGLELVISEQAAADVLRGMIPQFRVAEFFGGIEHGSLEIARLIHAGQAFVGKRRPRAGAIAEGCTPGHECG